MLDEALIAEALHHGAKGYAPKTATPDELIKAIRTTYAGELWVRRVLLTQVVERLRHQLQGHQVLTATTVPEAEAARQRFSPGHIDLVIANIHLTAAPEAREGYALYRRGRARYPGLPFLLLSGDPATADLPDIRGAVQVSGMILLE